MIRKASNRFQVSFLLTIMILSSATWTLGEQDSQTPTVRLGKRNSPSDTNSQEQEVYNYLDDRFLSDIRFVVNRLQSTQYRPLFIHTTYMKSDVLVFVRQNAINVSSTINTSVYQNLKVISHLPVTAVSLLIPDLFANNGTLTGSQLTDDTKQRLIQFDDAVWNISNQISSEFPDQVSSAQMEIIESVVTLLDSVLSQSDITITMDTLKEQFEPINQHLKTISEDAVRDYLICLNETVSALIASENITEEEWEDLIVILSLDPFAQSGSFLAQYYMKLLDANSSRFIFSSGYSSSRQTSPNCTVNAQNNSTNSLLSLSSFLLQQFVNEVFNDGNSSIHNLLSQAAGKIICNNVVFPSCVVPETVIVLSGFASRIERSYIVLMVLFGGFAVMFGIVLACIVYEDRVMTAEIKVQEAKKSLKIEGPTVFTPVSSIEDSIQLATPEERVSTLGASSSSGYLLDDNRTSTFELLASSSEA